MEHKTSVESCAPPLPLSTLRLLVPPVRLLSAAAWQTVRHKAVSDYGTVEEFVSTITDVVPELLTAGQRAQLLLGLRARLVLELCQGEATAHFELLKPHLDRLQVLIEEWLMEAGAANMEVSHMDFVHLVKNLLKNPDKKEHFFQKVFPEDFGPTYDEALHTLMWMFLSRLDKFLPLQTLQQVVSMFGEVSSVLEESMVSVSQCEELKTLLQHQRDFSQLDHNDGCLDGGCIITALKLPSVERSETDKTQASVLDAALPCASDAEKKSSAWPHTHRDQNTNQGKDKGGETIRALGENTTAVLLGDAEADAGRLQSREQDAACRLKNCSVWLKKLDTPQPAQHRPVRRNRGLRMQKILSEEKRGVGRDALPACKSAPRKRKPPSKDSSMAAVSGSDVGSLQKSPPVTHARSSTGDGSPSSCSDDTPSPARPKNASSPRAGVPKRLRLARCFICREQVSAGLESHVRTHFPAGDYACPRCDGRFKLFSSLRLHLSRTCFEHGRRRADPEKPDEAAGLHKCDKCDEAFGYKVSADMHRLTHHELYCPVCRKVLRDAAALARHRASHTAFQCSRCDRAFALFKPLLRHCENAHGIGPPFRCSRCPEAFSGLRGLIAHEWKHTGQLPFQCARCGARHRTDAELVSHERVHTKERPFLCAECGKAFSHKSNLLRHLNFIHSEARNEKRHPCPECEKSFKEKEALVKHRKRKHLNELSRHPCPYCGKMVSASTITRHKLIHTGERPFKCTVPECDKCFRSTSEVKRHVMINHTTERPYKCDVCGKGFIKKCFLNTHAKTHSGEKPFVCHFCGKAFPKLYSMKRHKKLIHMVVTQ